MDHKQRGMIIYKERVCISLTTANVMKINYLWYLHKSFYCGHDFKQLSNKLQGMHLIYHSPTSQQEKWQNVQFRRRVFHFVTA